ncbi:uroporphyrinogen-III C-methyltransferase [Litoribrevibacter albus]|uniref:Heme biosynthesis operon protein HemX n=1 Tax=Litoribrevibacter albus TaxID=1473156 RepID=A0AA37SEI9_9GAMM|nr:uroporphyrinogen-III C-methyltransferase [Litoribrevibacter albus]GLQ33066.1 hypothetical protein GCM10007876_35450 [Litoribrevibacter albus]
MQDSDKQDKPNPAEEVKTTPSEEVTEASSQDASESETASSSEPDKQAQNTTSDSTPKTAPVAANVTANHSSSRSASSSNSSSGSVSAQTASSGGGWLLGILLVLLIIGSAGGYWCWMQFQAMQDELAQVQETQARWAQRSSEREQQLDQLLAGHTAAVDSLTQLTGSDEEQQKQLKYLSVQLLSLTGVRRQDWEIARLEYLLRLASQRLQLDGDLEGARSTLLAADEYLKLLDDPRLIPVRKQVGKDLLTLNQSNRVDRAGLYIQLDSLLAQVPSLQPDKPEYNFVSAKEVSADQMDFADWVTQKLRGMIRLTSNEVKPSASWLSQEAKGQFNAMLSLRLLHAQQAVMAEDQTVYDAALAQAKELAETLYLGRGDSQKFVSKLSELQAMRVSMAEIDIGGSHQALKAYLEESQRAIREAMMRSLIQGSVDSSSASEGNN